VENIDEVVSLLGSIDRRLALLTAPQERDLRKALTEFLRTPARLAMLDAINGELGSRELSEIGGGSERAAQLFVNELLDLGFVRQTTASTRPVIVERDEAAIVAWYLKREAG
jgi:hypothetical protein